MTDDREIATVFSCAGCDLVGVLHKPENYRRRAVLIIVGGPQTRVGSHRQFVLLARHLASHSIAVLRADFRGMGDSAGDDRGFQNSADDIAAAIDFLWSELPGLEEVVLWGLCDAASAAMMYSPTDSRVSGLVLLNPWVRSEQGEARALVKKYYAARILSLDFWKQVIRGKVNIGVSVGSLISFLKKAFVRQHRTSSVATPNQSEPTTFQGRMLHSLEVFGGPVLLILSGEDLTAAEFTDLIGRSKRWGRALSTDRITRKDIPNANHTFSRREWRESVAKWCEDWLQSW